MCVCVWYSPYIREIYQDNDLSLPQLNEQLLYYTCCTHVLLYTVGCWPWLYALLDLGKKKWKITGSFVHVWPVYVYSKMDYYYYKYTAHCKRKRGTVSRSTGRTSAISIFSWTWNTTDTQTHGQPSSSSAYPKSRCVPAHESASSTSTPVAPDSNRICFRTITRCLRDRLSNTLILYNTFQVQLFRYWIEDTFLFLELRWDGILTWWLSGLSNVVRENIRTLYRAIWLIWLNSLANIENSWTERKGNKR